MKINLEMIEKEMPSEISPVTRGRLAETGKLAKQLLEQVQELSYELRPSMLDDLVLVPTVRWYVNRFAKRMNIKVEFEAVGMKKIRVLLAEDHTIVRKGLLSLLEANDGNYNVFIL